MFLRTQDAVAARESLKCKSVDVKSVIIIKNNNSNIEKNNNDNSNNNHGLDEIYTVEYE